MLTLPSSLVPAAGRRPRPRCATGQRLCLPLAKLLCALATLAGSLPALAGALYGINHTHWAINRFSVNGNPAIDIVGPYQRGGGGWGYSAPARWVPGMTVRVEWETGVAYAGGSPGFGDWPNYLKWIEEIDAQSRQLSKVVQVPDFTGEKVCGMTVHFLPCDEVQVTTSCYAYGSPEYPIKTALQLPEPTSCPQ